MTSPTIRSAATDDAAAIASVHIASSDDAYAPLAGSWPRTDADERAATWLERLRKGSSVLVAELDGCCSFYERHGGQLTERRPIDFHGATRTHVTYLWPSGASSERGG